EKAIEYEVRRQVALIEDGGAVVQETRLYDPERDETRSMRSKEDAQDYRYFPDPDLLPLEIAARWIAEVKAQMPPLPRALGEKLVGMGVAPHDATLLTETREKAEFFQQVAAGTKMEAKQVARWINGDLAALLNEGGRDFSQPPLAPAAFAQLLERIEDGTISGKGGKEVLHAMAGGEGSADEIIARRGLTQISDTGAIEAAVDQVLAANAKQVDDYRAGKEKAFNSLVGQVMKATQGKANPAQVNEILRRKLSG
ncbi:MAG TPA: Asp-tRNA(Asn)/Glu-tRNA(Gln) amidotransferase GatCAB subunit B, partial [Usitatibacter sp.]|nr:Asp-tRNA(Asn)/Glu-tRNA(Gln) amidotransferase GatCAB subunit B [Usitatibacter sp.]